MFQSFKINFQINFLKCTIYVWLHTTCPLLNIEYIMYYYLHLLLKKCLCEIPKNFCEDYPLRKYRNVWIKNCMDNAIIVYCDIGYYNIGFIRVTSM